ncbi:unnamed protein product [Symbiodinium natans]|uniref:Uncharacterized protein n=1 Tax=Symbiodinium natans TaxID=878477 RepID=A0A812L9C2_9DINO|nr:unnamed protein product [Symbiodinium natans]
MRQLRVSSESDGEAAFVQVPNSLSSNKGFIFRVVFLFAFIALCACWFLPKRATITRGEVVGLSEELNRIAIMEESLPAACDSASQLTAVVKEVSTGKADKETGATFLGAVRSTSEICAIVATAANLASAGTASAYTVGICGSIAIAASMGGAALADEASGGEVLESKVNGMITKLSKKMNREFQVLKDEISDGFDTVLDGVKDVKKLVLTGQLDDIHTTISVVNGWYKDYIIELGLSASESGLVDSTLRSYESALSPDKFETYVDTALQLEKSWERTVQFHVPKFVRARTQILALREALCLLERTCKQEFFTNRANDVKNDMKEYKKTVAKNSLFDISNKNFADLGHACFKWHSDSEYRSIHGYIDDLPKTLTRLDLPDTINVRGNVKNLPRHLTYIQHHSTTGKALPLALVAMHWRSD